MTVTRDCDCGTEPCGASDLNSSGCRKALDERIRGTGGGDCQSGLTGLGNVAPADFEDGDVILLTEGRGGGGDVLGGEDRDGGRAVEAEQLSLLRAGLHDAVGEQAGGNRVRDE